MNTQSDIIHIRELEVRCIVGVNDCERATKQTVTIDIDLSVDTRAAAASQDLTDTVNYRTVSKLVQAEIGNSTYLLMESLVQRVADLCLGEKHAQAVRVTAWKPEALRGVRNVGVTIKRNR